MITQTGLSRTQPDSEVLRRAREIALRLLLPRPPHPPREQRGSREFVSLPYREGGSVDLDIDRTLERLVERPFPKPTDAVVRERSRRRRTVVLAIDVSGSMRGERLSTAAATLAALAVELRRDDLGVVAFWSDAAVLLEAGQPIRPLDLLDSLFALPAQGLTNITFPLEVAARQLAPRDSTGARVLLLSDCVHNAGPDPRRAAARLPRLDVLLDVFGEKDVDLGRELSRAGRGLLLPIRSHRDIAAAVHRAFSD